MQTEESPKSHLNKISEQAHVIYGKKSFYVLVQIRLNCGSKFKKIGICLTEFIRWNFKYEIGKKSVQRFRRL
jgi:hypothetical protein